MSCVFGDYTLDRQRYELRRHDQRIALEPKAFDLLLYLIEHRDRVVGRDELLEQVWPEQFLSDHSLTARLRSVRQAPFHNPSLGSVPSVSRSPRP